MPKTHSGAVGSCTKKGLGIARSHECALKLQRNWRCCAKTFVAIKTFANRVLLQEPVMTMVCCCIIVLNC